MMLWLRGYPDQALDRCREAMALAERVAHPLTMALAQWAFSYVHLMRREPDAGAPLGGKGGCAVGEVCPAASPLPGQIPTRLGTSRSGTADGGNRRDARGPDRHQRDRSRDGNAVLPEHIGGGARTEWSGD